MALPRTQATLLEKLLFIPLVFRVLGAVAYRIATYGFTKTRANKPLKDLVFAVSVPREVDIFLRSLLSGPAIEPYAH